MSICLLDTSVFVELLNVPNMNAQHDTIIDKLKQKLDDDEFLFLPMATILETGNHIAQNGDGAQRRNCADSFVNQVQLALDGKSSFKPIVFPQQDALQQWLAVFPDFAMRGQGLGDLSIVQDWERMCKQNPAHRVYIWSLDQHLASYDRKPFCQTVCN